MELNLFQVIGELQVAVISKDILIASLRQRIAELEAQVQQPSFEEQPAVP